MRIKLDKDTITVDENDNSLAAQIIAGCEGKLIIKTPYGKREIKQIKDSKGKKIGKLGKNKKEK